MKRALVIIGLICLIGAAWWFTQIRDDQAAAESICAIERIGGSGSGCDTPSVLPVLAPAIVGVLLLVAAAKLPDRQ